MGVMGVLGDAGMSVGGLMNRLSPRNLSLNNSKESDPDAKEGGSQEIQE